MWGSLFRMVKLPSYTLQGGTNKTCLKLENIQVENNQYMEQKGVELPNYMQLTTLSLATSSVFNGHYSIQHIYTCHLYLHIMPASKEAGSIQTVAVGGAIQHIPEQWLHIPENSLASLLTQCVGKWRP